MAEAQQQPANIANLNEEQSKLVQDLEMEMVTDMYSRLSSVCHKKCIAPKYREADLQKGESVCIAVSYTHLTLPTTPYV